MRKVAGSEPIGYFEAMGTAHSAVRRYSWDDYRYWPDGERWELIHGQPFAMSPAPSSRHQAVCGDLYGLLFDHFRDRSCRVFFAPTDVKLSAHDVVQPDLFVVCDRSQIKKTHVEGPPVLVIEVLSPSSQRHDRVRKLQLYAESGVGEFWLVQPYPAVVEVLQLAGGSYRVVGAYAEDDRLLSPTFPDLAIDLGQVFTLPVEPEDQVDEIRESAPPYVGAPASP